MIKKEKKAKVLAKAHRFEVRCTPAFRQLAEKLREIEERPTFSSLFREMVIDQAYCYEGSKWLAVKDLVETCEKERGTWDE